MPEGGETIGHFRLLQKVGTGGFATVYRAQDLRLGREVALKILHPQLASDAAFVARFDAEAKAGAGIRHPHIVTLYEVGVTDSGVPFIVMEFVEGQTLSRILARQGTLPVADVVNLVAQLASALDYLHARRIVHRDIKPANVMVGADGQATLMDLGIARSLDAAGLTLAGQAVGTPVYMAPEQITGQPIGPSVDNYALGILAYELLAGKPPFQGSTSVVMRQQVTEAPPPLRSRNPNVLPSVAAVVERMLSKGVAERYESAGVFARSIADAAREAPAGSTIIKPPAPAAVRDRSPVPGSVPPVQVDAAVNRPSGPPPARPPATTPARPAAAPPTFTPPAAGSPTPWTESRSQSAMIWLLAGLIALIVILSIVALLVTRGKKSPSTAAPTPAAATGASTSLSGASTPLATLAAVASATSVSAAATRVATVSAPNPTSPDQSTLTQSFNSSNRGYSIKYPAGWTAAGNQPLSAGASATADYLSSANGTLRVSIATESGVAPGTGLEPFRESERAALQKSADRVQDAGSVAVDSGRGELELFSRRASGADGAQVYYVAGARGYFVFTLTAPIGQRDAALPVFLGMLQSFRQS